MSTGVWRKRGRFAKGLAWRWRWAYLVAALYAVVRLYMELAGPADSLSVILGTQAGIGALLFGLAFATSILPSPRVFVVAATSAFATWAFVDLCFAALDVVASTRTITPGIRE